MSPEPVYLQVLKKRNEAQGVVSLELSRIDGTPLPHWEPGAHIDVTLPNGLTRQYSLCGAPERRDLWRIAVLDEPQSRGGSRLIHESVSEGDVLTASPPRNHFPLVDASAYVFVAGGIGITPILPMLDRVSRNGKAWLLIYGGRARANMAFLDEISSFPKEAVQVCPHDEIGLIDLTAIEDFINTDMAIYCCGPGTLIDAVETRFGGRAGIAVYRERFTASASAHLEEGAFEVELARTGGRLIVPPFESMLRVLHDAGCDVPHSCEAGICGTCAVRVLAGTPDHRDDVLTDRERDAGDVMLPCVSRALSSRLVVDL